MAGKKLAVTNPAPPTAEAGKKGERKEPDPKHRKQMGAKCHKLETSGEAEKPTKKKQAMHEKHQASGGARKPTPTKRMRGDAELQQEVKSEARRSGEGQTRSPTPAKKLKDKAAAAAVGADHGAGRFPTTRVRQITRAEDASIRPSNEAVFLVNKAAEIFLKRFAEDAYRNTLKDRKKSIAYDNLSTAVCNQKKYKFLSDFVPEKVTAEDVLKAPVINQVNQP
ncbi:hypothetical protein GUJ93_ZPchr0013g33922 [Zizania palustris]|uniref:Transcription factor CBF/NF-Y/archaeal histone domain-containing protein n=1 Tax=Zizania palustris TaxID=103762 RepID=A0A8J5WWH7_ZIZPA|nr:hypothetical protein GUJ93_ZPchr0013g33922 [Zizania palustris]